MLKIVSIIVTLILLTLIGAFFYSQHNQNDKFEHISIYDLLTNFEDLHRTKVIVKGYLAPGSGFLNLYPTKEDYRIKDISRAISVSPIENHLKTEMYECVGHYVEIYGYFMRHEDFKTGHVITLVERVSILDENNKYNGYSICAK